MFHIIPATNVEMYEKRSREEKEIEKEIERKDLGEKICDMFFHSAYLVLSLYLILSLMSWIMGDSDFCDRKMKEAIEFFATKANAVETVSTPVVIVGGWGGTKQQLEFLKKEIPGSIIMMDNVATSVIPTGDVSKQVAVLEAKMKASGIAKATFIAHSYGGLVVMGFAKKHPEAIEKIILIATPNAGYKHWPFENAFISEEIPLYVISGVKPAKKWYLNDEENDGVVELSSSFSIPISGDARMFQLGHFELIHSKEVANQVNAWLAE